MVAAGFALAVSHGVPAHATVTVGQWGVIVSDGSDQVVVSCSHGVLVASGVTAGQDCATVTDLSVLLGDGQDSADLSAVTRTTFPALRSPRIVARDSTPDPRPSDVVTGSPLGDRIEGDWRDTIDGGGGDDVISGGLSPAGGPGDDTMIGGTLVVSGGDGDDRFVNSEYVDGGPGRDHWDADLALLLSGIAPPQTFTMTDTGLSTDRADDANPALRFGGPVEIVTLTLVPASSESYDGSTFTGRQSIRTLDGDDTVVTGPAADTALAGAGNDRVTSGAGADLISLGEGDDRAVVRDGEVDDVDCGAGADIVVADAIDRLVRCEEVLLPVPRTSRIAGKRSYAKPEVAKFGFSSPIAGASFQCRLDNGRWKACTSRHKVRTARLSLGEHTLRVRAVLAGRVDASPSVKRFDVTR